MGRKFLIIDDSALMRRVISDIIKLNSEYEVLDTAVDGVDGLDKLVAHPGYYDLVILDINMPKMNGLEMLEMLQKNHMHEAVVVVSTVAIEGAKETLRALELGALDFVKKPENFYEVKGDGFKNKILKVIEMVTGSDYNRVPVATMPTHTDVRVHVPVKRVKPGTNKIVAIACSTGGPKSLQQVIPYLPENLDAGVVLVQHMPKGFTASLAMRLNSLSKAVVKEAEDGEVIENGHVYIAPGGMHIIVAQSGKNHVIRYSDQPPVDGLRPCANIMFESLSDTDYDDITCVVLTGMGADGTKGIQSLVDKGRRVHVIAQDAESCIVYGMPRAIAEAGLANEIQPLNKISESIIKNVGVM